MFHAYEMSNENYKSDIFIIFVLKQYMTFSMLSL